MALVQMFFASEMDKEIWFMLKLTKLMELRVSRDVIIVHTFQEGNKLANYLTNMVVNFPGRSSIILSIPMICKNYSTVG
ncbi:hypothetical protein H5410_032165 [Solanum commersonii]|uniref:Uncharacterized protein n=1 Tax=Solanum commersonii TaxID=4109 RepID=A0A9J5YJ71_SOLCO|nr:hypothetical protein H5410_032165 [Solanum commersonii]